MRNNTLTQLLVWGSNEMHGLGFFKVDSYKCILIRTKKFAIESIAAYALLSWTRGRTDLKRRTFKAVALNVRSAA